MKAFLDANLLIYLNVGSTEEILDLWISLLTRYDLYTDPLVLDETLWVSKKKYRVPWRDTVDFIRDEILPYTTILPLGEREYLEATDIILSHDLRPSDALHVAAMKTNGISTIASEDREYDQIPWIKRIWIQTPPG